MTHNRMTGLFAAMIFLFGVVWSNQPVANPYTPRASGNLDTVTYFTDARIVYKVATMIVADSLFTNLGAFVATIDRRTVDTTAIPPATIRSAAIIYSPAADSALVITYDTLAMSPIDSAAVDAQLIAWANPSIGYIVFVPGQPATVDRGSGPVDTTTPPPGAPDQPTNLVLVADTTNSRITSSWTGAVDSYVVNGGLNAGGQEWTDTVAALLSHRLISVDGTYFVCVKALESGLLSSNQCDLVDYDKNIPPPPTPGGLTDTTGALFVFDYDIYANAGAYRNDTGFFSSPTGNTNIDFQFITTFIPFTGLVKSVRYDWVYIETCEFGNPAAFTGCDSRTIGRAKEVPNPFTAQEKEIWMEIAVRFSHNFTACSAWDQPCDHKTLFLQVWPDENGRWEWHLTGGGGAAWAADRSYSVIMSGPRGLVTGDPSSQATWSLTGDGPGGRHFWFKPGVDTTWQVFRMYVKHSTMQGNTIATNSMDARMVVWHNDILVYDTEAWIETGQSPSFGTYNTKAGSGDTYVRALLLGVNKDKGAGDVPSDSFPRTESMYLGRATLWDTDPGWLKWPLDTPTVGTF